VVVRGALAAGGALLLLMALGPIFLLVVLGRLGNRGLALVERAMRALDRWAGIG
jgi:hypothetical protein